MRQQQQKNRLRGRGRKPVNPMSRNYESNGPDVKIRGNAAHIAERYAALARDAASAGDRVMAENYLQHAEHYSRIVAGALAASQARYEEHARYGSGPQPDSRPSAQPGMERAEEANPEESESSPALDSDASSIHPRGAEADAQADGSFRERDEELPARRSRAAPARAPSPRGRRPSPRSREAEPHGADSESGPASG